MSVRLIVGCIAAAGVAVMSAVVGGAAEGRAVSAPAAAPGQPAAGAVRIIRDEYGVPHVYARTARALFYGDGYATGQDRLWEAEVLRLTASGTVAQAVGPGQKGSNVLADLAARIYSGGPIRLHALFQRLPARSRTAVQGFVEGMNAWIRHVDETGKLPPEYAALGFRPRPWTAEDVLAIWAEVGGQRGAFGSDELDNAAEDAAWKARFGAAAAARLFADTHWTNDPSSPTTIPAPPGAVPPGPVTPGPVTPGPVAPGPVTPGPVPPGLARPVPAAARARATALVQAGDRQLAHAGLALQLHSNAIAIGKRLTRDGIPLLLGGPQTGYSVPQTFMEIGLHGAGYDVTGATIPGTAAVEIGVGSGDAWSVTSGGTDNSDWYVETLDPAHHPGRYLFRGRWVPYRCRTEAIPVRGHRPQPRRVCESVHGPVYATANKTAISLRDATRGGIGATFGTFLGVDRSASAASPRDFGAALRGSAGNFNFLYADQHGNIAYWHIGRIPIRAAGDNPFLPHPGDGSDEWRGFIPFDHLPHVTNPAQGWLANWTTKPIATWPNSTAGLPAWGPAERVQVLFRLLSAIPPRSATMATLASINRVAGQTAENPVGDEENVPIEVVLPRLLSHLSTAGRPRLRRAAALLRAWNRQRADSDSDHRYDNPAVAIYNRWYADFVSHAFAREYGKPDSGSPLDNTTFANLAVRLLEGRAAALPLRYHYLHAETVTQAVTAALRDALNGLTRQYRSADPARWLQPVVNIQWSPLGIGKVPDTPWMNRGTYNQIVHVGPGGGLTAEDVVAPGQSGVAASRHFADQLRLYVTWAYKPMRLTKRDLVGHTESVLTLAVPSPCVTTRTAAAAGRPADDRCR
jgi:penicillin amidase